MEHNIPVPPTLPNNMVVESKINVTNTDNTNGVGSNSGTTSGKIRIHRSNLEELKMLSGLPDEAFEFMTEEEEIELRRKNFEAMIEYERSLSNWW